ncbi:MAG: hypothetical protein ACYDEV_00495 [Acidiferrobacter sp.]
MRSLRILRIAPLFLLCALAVGPANGRLLTAPITPFHGFLANIMGSLSRSVSLGMSVGVVTTRRVSSGPLSSGLLFSVIAEGLPLSSLYSPLVGIRIEGRF